ncbi:kinase-like protein [Punctularia strigosozonata HHB-11173 SS5]|uniref:kinase-like protein n=1 Tax=Punctularia strigosozonata (strain HHB-11173) TaxID=741275 RepID=UPI00044167DB|nr:kinase-like protein [Punctularia strigosozonata HHB-11173 SS5]EIN13654.1 kinase-like protein [Punctularia strigosozonata HHB-11173 SS5]
MGSHLKHKTFIGAVEDEWQLYSDSAADYTIGPPIGFGASSIVYAATYHPLEIQCAVKVLDLDALPPHALGLLRRETRLMSLSKHPNVLRVRGSWMNGHKLYIALRLMNAGSAADVMRYAWPGGMEEDVVVCILKQALEGLNYLHVNGFIHRDVKAANLLIDDDGTVLLGDLGVAADLTEHESSGTSWKGETSANPRRLVSFDSAAHAHAHAPVRERPRIGKRKSFVGTPAWMAPEVIRGKQYDASADIWSFGITAIELAQGRAPRSRESSHRVLLQIVQDAPPTFKREAGPHKYSRAFQEMVESCLNKDPAARPTAAALLQLPLFKSAKRKSHLVHTVLKGLPPLAQRQERRKLPSVHTRTSIDSWDFSLSPTTSVYGHGHGHSQPPTVSSAHRHRFSIQSQEALSVTHERERSAEKERGRMPRSDSRVSIPSISSGVGLRSGATSRSHSRAVSWHDTDDDQPLAGSGILAEPIKELDVDPLSSSPSSAGPAPGPTSPADRRIAELVRGVQEDGVDVDVHEVSLTHTASVAPVPIPLPTAASLVHLPSPPSSDVPGLTPESDTLGVPSSLPQLSTSPSTHSTSSGSSISLSSSRAPPAVHARKGSSSSASGSKWRKFSFGAGAAGAKPGVMSSLLRKTASARGAAANAVAKATKS